MVRKVNQNSQHANSHDDEFQERAGILEFDGHLNRRDAEHQARLLHPEAPSTALKFPSQAIVGSVGDLARLLGHGTEVPEEFHFAAALTLLGCFCATSLRLNIGLHVAPRLYTVILGESGVVKKSTALHKNIEIFNEISAGLNVPKGGPYISYGVGSAEGLMKQLKKYPKLLIAYDELRAFVDKAHVQNSTLLPMVTSLFESTDWDNITSRTTQSVRDVHLSLLGCCTSGTYDAMWTSAAISIGLLNRLFIVAGDRKEKIAWPSAPDPLLIDACKTRITKQIERLPLTLGITEEGQSAWTDYYYSLPLSEHAKRLDAIGFRLLALIALVTDKDEVDLQTVETVTAILDYELKIRQLTDPIDCDNKIARIEEGVRRLLSTLGPLTQRDLRIKLHADRYGLWVLERSLSNLVKAGDVRKLKIGKADGYASKL